MLQAETDRGWVDLHCHMLPGVDDGAGSWEESLAMARLAVEDGTIRTVVTPHQLGRYAGNTAATIRERTSQLQQRLHEAEIPLLVLPGADVRIEPDLVARLGAGEVLTLADRGRHVLLELPHELYFPLQPLLTQLDRAGYVGVLSHPERNRGLLAHPVLLTGLVSAGCLLQVTAGSLLGNFGAESQRLAEWMLHQRLVHIIASDAHAAATRRPLLRRAFDRTVALTDVETARRLFSIFPRRISEGRDIPSGRVSPPRRPHWWSLPWVRSA
jgi:protein-tyrosine phosphatase